MAKAVEAAVGVSTVEHRRSKKKAQEAKNRRIEDRRNDREVEESKPPEKEKGDTVVRRTQVW
jgi:hypothetical protein